MRGGNINVIMIVSKLDYVFQRMVAEVFGSFLVIKIEGQKIDPRARRGRGSSLFIRGAYFNIGNHPFKVHGVDFMEHFFLSNLDMHITPIARQVTLIHFSI